MGQQKGTSIHQFMPVDTPSSNKFLLTAENIKCMPDRTPTKTINNSHTVSPSDNKSSTSQ